MLKVTKEMVLASLDREWDGYVGRMARMPAAQREEFLKRQGFQSASDLLIHIAGWWRECIEIVAGALKDPAYKPPNIDVDAFNRNAVAENKGNSEEDTIRIFNAAKAEILKMIRDLPEDAVGNETINDFLYWCVTNHFTEHRVD
jgi:hypothetical protein